MTPTDQESQLDWRVYERMAAALLADNVSGIDITVTPNARIIGSISGTERQVDMLIDARWGDDHSGRVIADAKLHGRKIDIKHVEEFEGMMRDCRAGHGIIVCPHGWTEAAMHRAMDAISVTLLSREDALEFAAGALEPCFGECSKQLSKKGSRSGLVLWDSQLPLIIGGLYAITWVGKCDTCHNFHVWCWECGEKFALTDEDEHHCGCGKVWSTLIEAEAEGAELGEDVAVHLFLCFGQSVLPLDRRMLR